MPFAESDYLPSYEELDVQEINLSSAPLRAGAHHVGKYCDIQSKEFMLCMQEEKDPRKCLNEGKEVTRCGLEFFQKLKKQCATEFTNYWKCIDHSGHDMNYKNCRKPQGIYDQCVFEKMGQERTPPGYFSKVRTHHTTRPKPTRDLPLPEPTPEVPRPEDNPVPESAKYGQRFVWE